MSEFTHYAAGEGTILKTPPGNYRQESDMLSGLKSVAHKIKEAGQEIASRVSPLAWYERRIDLAATRVEAAFERSYYRNLKKIARKEIGPAVDKAYKEVGAQFIQELLSTPPQP